MPLLSKKRERKTWSEDVLKDLLILENGRECQYKIGNESDTSWNVNIKKHIYQYISNILYQSKE